MLYHIFYALHDKISAFNIFRYITFRAAMAALTSFLISVLVGPIIIRKLQEWKIGEKIGKGDSARLDEIHRSKHNTPTMGGLLILLAIFISTALWADMFNAQVLIALFATLWLGVTGFADDYCKQTRKKGISARTKLISQIVLGIILGLLLLWKFPGIERIDIPFFKDLAWNLGIAYILFVTLVISGTSNAVNLTDGLDGLAIGVVVMVSIAFSVLCYVTGNINFSEYLLIPYIKGSGELTVFCASIFGAGLGFLWFNCYPATIFMGDVGSLALGGALGIVALLIKKELILMVAGGIFVLEALSVILQVGSYKLTKKRIFMIAPLHHHFQFMKIPENKIIVRFWILAAFLALVILVTLKIR